jgi:hypothetical protein
LRLPTGQAALRVRSIRQNLSVKILTFSGRKTKLLRGAGKAGNDYAFSEFQGAGDDLLTEGGDVVRVCVRDLFDETMRSESLE